MAMSETPVTMIQGRISWAHYLAEIHSESEQGTASKK